MRGYAAPGLEALQWLQEGGLLLGGMPDEALETVAQDRVQEEDKGSRRH